MFDEFSWNYGLFVEATLIYTQILPQFTTPQTKHFLLVITVSFTKLLVDYDINFVAWNKTVFYFQATNFWNLPRGQSNHKLGSQ